MAQSVGSGDAELACHCGLIRVRIGRRPDHINACNCTSRTKTGAWWGYFDPAEVSVEGAATGDRWADKPDPGAEIRLCRKCGATTHFVLAEAAIVRFGNTMTGVDMRLADDSDLAGIELRYPGGRGRAGEGAFGYVRWARIIGEG